jgi:very-short-patch-repair endonuclease
MRASSLSMIHRIADRSFGLITRDDLRQRCRLSESGIGRLMETGLLIRVYRGVYRLAGARGSLQQRALAAVWACGPGAVASGPMAGDLWELFERPSGLIVVTVPYARNPKPAGILVRRSTDLPRNAVTMLGRIPITTVARTLRDLPRHLTEEAFDEAIRQRRVRPTEFERAPGYLGKLARDRLGLGVPHGKIVRKAIAVLRKARLPDPVREHPITFGGRNYFIDIAYPDRRIAIECRGEAPHWGRERFRHDIDRSNALELAGWDEYTFTWWHVTADAASMVATVRGALGVH